MFRYLGFTWDLEAPNQVIAAHRVASAIQDAEGWRVAHSSPGLRVFTNGNRSGVNDIYALPRARGVVLGHLFRRGYRPSVHGDVDLSGHDGQAILQTEGRSLIENYWGRYVAVLRLNRPGIRLLRDPSGTLPCFQKDVDGVTVFFSWLEDLIALTPHLPTPEVKWDAVAAFIALGPLGGHETALEGVDQILPGQLTTLGKDAPPPLTLWSAVAVAGRPIESKPHVAASQLRYAVMDCVDAWASVYDSVLLRLSGGVDSAILLGSLRASGAATRIACLNYHSPGSNSDERSFARLAAEEAGLDLIEKERNIDFRLEDVLAVSRTPTPEVYVGRMGTNRVDAAVASAHGADAMFTGVGGDALFFELRCTWPAADYLAAHGPGRGFLRASLDAARLARVSLWQSIWRALADQGHRTSPLDTAGEFLTLIRREAIEGVRQSDRYVHPDLLGEPVLPIGKYHQLQDLINPLGYYDPHLREAMPEMVNPLLSQPLIELCLALPTWLLTHGGRGRALARQAFAAELPRAIATRQSKGGMDEHVTRILHSNLSFVRELLLDGRLVGQGLVDRKKLEAALAGRLSASDGYVGEIHNYTAIEIWLRRFVDSPSR